MTRARLVAELRKALATGGIRDANQSGAATTVAAHGIEDLQIKLLGRWRSEAFQRYIRPEGPQLAKLAKCLSTTEDATKRVGTTTEGLFTVTTGSHHEQAGK